MLLQSTDGSIGGDGRDHEGKHPELEDKVITPDVILHPHNASLQLTFYDGKQFPADYRGDILPPSMAPGIDRCASDMS